MKQPITDVARREGLHPANLLIKLAATEARFDEIWPDIEMRWLESPQRKESAAGTYSLEDAGEYAFTGYDEDGYEDNYQERPAPPENVHDNMLLAKDLAELESDWDDNFAPPQEPPRIFRVR